MQNQSDTQARPAPQSSPGEELVGETRPNVRAQVGATGFTLLLVATLVVPVVMDVEAMPGLSLVNLGMLLMVGFAELIDVRSRGFLLGLRLGGITIALLGLVILLL
ncbi:MAG: hypothetical protein L0H39_00815 [Brachybacterium sp.]|nr:hypothetical protein [Brachybacterium sp.]